MAARYQEGSIDRVHRAKGAVWVFRWRELQPDGTRVQRKKTIGTVKRYPTQSAAKKAVENLRAEVNAQEDRMGKQTVRDAWGHFQLHELRNPVINRSAGTIQGYLDYFKLYILPKWGDLLLEEVDAVAVEQWLNTLVSREDSTQPLAPGTRTKIRNHMSALFSHAIRHQLYAPAFQGVKGGGKKDVWNPIAMVRTSSEPVRETEVLTLTELRAIITRIGPQAIRVMVLVAGASALRRSEVRGLKWTDLDFDGLRFNLKQGVLRKEETRLKTRASRKPVPMLPELAEVLRQWREETAYPADNNWVFASPFTQGHRPYWAESAMVDHIRPAAIAAGITKHLHWHVFRHSVGTILSNHGEGLKTIQELLRHASPAITAKVYLHGDDAAKRSALSHVSGIFVVPKPAA